MNAPKMRNIGPKSAAWLRQVGLRSFEDLQRVGSVEAFAKIKRAGFKPSLNLLYALEGALLDCHWHDVPEARRQQLLAELETASAALPPPRGRPVGGPVTTAFYGSDGEARAEPGGDDQQVSADDQGADEGGNRFI